MWSPSGSVSIRGCFLNRKSCAVYSFCCFPSLVLQSCGTPLGCFAWPRKGQNETVPDLVPVLGEYQFAPKRHALLKTHGPHHSTRWYAAAQSHAAGLTDFRQSQRSSKDSDDDTYGDEIDADDDISDDEYFDDDDEGGDFDDVSGSLAAIKGYAGCALSSRPRC
jgi:hypothetical protein